MLTDFKPCLDVILMSATFVIQPLFSCSRRKAFWFSASHKSIQRECTIGSLAAIQRQAEYALDLLRKGREMVSKHWKNKHKQNAQYQFLQFKKGGHFPLLWQIKEIFMNQEQARLIYGYIKKKQKLVSQSIRIKKNYGTIASHWFGQ